MAILPSGTTTAVVTVRDPSPWGSSRTATVLVDTGSELSALPDHSVSAALAHATWGPLVTFHVAGASFGTIVANGVICEIDVEPHGGGGVSTASLRIGIPIHYVAAGASPFVAFDGLLKRRGEGVGRDRGCFRKGEDEAKV